MQSSGWLCRKDCRTVPPLIISSRNPPTHPKMHTFPPCTLLPLVLLLAAPAYASAPSYLPDGTPVQAGAKDDAPFLATWVDGAWTPIAIPAELVPTKGDFESVAADPSGNLYVAYSDESNPKKETSGLLARVDGTWSRLGPFQKTWSARSHLVARSPTDVFLEVWETKAGKALLLHWNGAAFDEVPLPEGTEELEDLLDSGGSIVVLVDSPSGDHTYRLAEGAWTAMGAVASESMALLRSGPDGSLWRLGRAAERWDGAAWEEVFTFPNSSLDGFRIDEACVGANGELYVVLEDQDYKDHLAYWPGHGSMGWYKGDPEQARFKYGLVDLFRDRDGALRLESAGEMMRFTLADFDYETDGYPSRDDRAREVLDLFDAFKQPYKELSLELVRLGKAMEASGSESDVLTYKDKAQETMVWASQATERMKALGLQPGRNRLYDANVAFLDALHDYVFLDYKRAEALQAGNLDADLLDAWMKSNTRLQIAFGEVQEEATAYTGRNGL